MMDDKNVEIMPGVTLVDALAEVANIGAGNSSTRLEKALKEKISKNLLGNSLEIDPQLIEYCHLSNIEYRFPLTTHAGFYSILKIDDSSAIISVLFSMESALFITGLMEGKEKHYEILREEDERTLKEIAENLIDAYTESTATFLNLPIAHTQTKKIYLKPNSIMDFVKESIGEGEGVVLLFKTGFSVKKTSFKGDLKIMFSLTEMEPIVDAIKKNLGIEVSTPKNDPHRAFHLYQGGTLLSLNDLSSAMQTMNDAVFFHHVTPFRNDFAAWTYEVLGEKELAIRLGEEKTKDGMRRIIEEHMRGRRILNEQSNS